MVSENVPDTVAPLASVAVSVKLFAPAAVGVPASVPAVEFRRTPAGRVPPVRAQVTGWAPPAKLRSAK